MERSVARRAGLHILGSSIAWLLSGMVVPVDAQVAAAPAVGPASWASAVNERYAAEIDADVVADDVGGMTAGVVVGADLAWSRGFGRADRESGREAGPQTVYRVGSISKTVTAVVLMDLVDRGVVDLDAPVVAYLPAFAGLGGPPATVVGITLRQLASHTAGLIREPRLAGAATGPLDEWESKLLASIPATSVEHPPGSRYAYSNIGFGILGLALSRAAGQPFMEIVRERVFARLGMEHSAFVVSPAVRRNLATGYANGRPGPPDAEQPAREHAGRGYKVPNGGVYSTVGDIARFVAELTGAGPTQLLSSRSRAELLSIQTPGDSLAGYALGLAVRTTESGIRLIGHGGSVAGYTAHAVFDPESRIGVILLRNYNRGRTNLRETAAAWLVDLVTALGRPR